MRTRITTCAILIGLAVLRAFVAGDLAWLFRQLRKSTTIPQPIESRLPDDLPEDVRSLLLHIRGQEIQLCNSRHVMSLLRGKLLRRVGLNEYGRLMDLLFRRDA